MSKIQDIIPFMRKGWVAMDKDSEWYWYPLVPDTDFNGEWRCNAVQSTYTLKAFDIAPAEDWTKSLISVGNNPKNKVFDVDEFYKELFEND